MEGKNKNLTKRIILGVFLTGGIAIACTNPKFGQKVLPEIIKLIKYKYKNKKERNKISSVFYRLKKDDLINVEFRNKQIFISLTEEGKNKAGKYKIDDLEIKKDVNWDKKWRILIFDVKEKDVTPAMRDNAKRVNFGIMYGMSAFGLAKDLNIPQDEAQLFIDKYFLIHFKYTYFFINF